MYHRDINNHSRCLALMFRLLVIVLAKTFIWFSNLLVFNLLTLLDTYVLVTVVTLQFHKSKLYCVSEIEDVHRYDI